MSMLDFDPVSAAGAAAHAAAARLYGALTDHEAGHDDCWMAPAAILDAGQVSDLVETMAAFVCQRQVHGEVLFLTARLWAGWPARAAWAELTRERQLAFDVFCNACKFVVIPLREAQSQAEAKENPPRHVERLALKDSILEPLDDANEEVEWADELRRLRAAAEAKPNLVTHTAAPATRPEPEAPAEGQPMGLGEALPAPPENRGGRPRTGSAAAKQAAKPRSGKSTR